MITLASLYEKYSSKGSAPLISASTTTKSDFVTNLSVLKCDMQKLFFEKYQQTSNRYFSWLLSSPDDNVLTQLAIYLNEVVACTQKMFFTTAAKNELLTNSLTALAQHLQRDLTLKPLLKALNKYEEYLTIKIDWEALYGKNNLPVHLKEKVVSEEQQALLPKLKSS